MKRQTGFTIIELILVVIIVGLLAITMMPKSTEHGIALIAETEAVVDLLDSARKEAITRHQNITFKVTSSQTCRYKNSDNNLPPDLTTLQLSYSNFSNSNFSITFNAAGVPSDHQTYSLTLLANSLRTTITIEPSTGRITYEKS